MSRLFRDIYDQADNDSGPSSSSGAHLRNETEWVLQPGAVYLIRATNRAGAAQPMGITVEFYEID